MKFLNIPPIPAIEEQWKLTSARFSEWLQGDILKPIWWIMLALFAITAYLGWKKADKTRLAEISIYSLFIILSIIVLDELGEELTLWYYPMDLFFMFPPITAVNITCMPLVYMLIYQRFSSWKSFTVATLIMSAVFCFVFEPIFVWSGIYVMLKWKSYYGFPIYAFIAFFSKFAVHLIYTISPKKKPSPIV